MIYILYTNQPYNDFTCNALKNYLTDFDKITRNKCYLVQFKI